MQLPAFGFGEARTCNVFVRRTGKSQFKVFNSAGTIAVGAAVQFDEGGEVVIGATNKQAIGVAVAAATSSTTCTVDIIDRDSEWEATAETTAAVAGDVGKQIDFSSGSGVAVDPGVTTNNDFTVTGFISSTKLIVCFNQGGLTKTVVGLE